MNRTMVDRVLDAVSVTVWTAAMVAVVVELVRPRRPVFRRLPDLAYAGCGPLCACGCGRPECECHIAGVR